jgi:hypothetical protein
MLEGFVMEFGGHAQSTSSRRRNARHSHARSKLERKAKLAELVQGSRIGCLYHSDYFVDGEKLLAECCHRRLEGIVSKRREIAQAAPKAGQQQAETEMNEISSSCQASPPDIELEVETERGLAILDPRQNRVRRPDSPSRAWVRSLAGSEKSLADTSQKIAGAG